MLWATAGACAEDPWASTAAAARAALDLDAQVQAALAHPAMHIYVGCSMPRLLLREFALDIDSQPMVHRTLNTAEAEALSRGGLVDLTVLSVPHGPHRLHAYFAAGRVGASPYEPREVATMDTHWGQASEPGALVFEVAKSMLHTAELKLTVMAPAGAAPPTTLDTVAYAPGSPADPEVRVGEWFLQQRQPLLAASRFGAVRAGAQGAASDRYGDALQMLADRDTTPVMPAAAGSAPGAAATASASSNPDATLVADRQNLAQGYDALRAFNYAEAAGFFRKVHSPGPCANRALLGLGWALAGRGGSKDGAANKDATQSGAAPQSIAAVRERMPVSVVGDGASGAHDALRDALVPWTELIGRERFDPAVQEGSLAVAYALDNVGDHQAASDQYDRALSMLAGTRAEIARGLEDIRKGHLIGDVFPRHGDILASWHHTLAHLEAHPEQEYVRALIVDPAFERAASDYLAMLSVRSLLDHDRLLLGAAPGAPDAAALDERLGALRLRLDAALKPKAAAVDSAAIAALESCDHITARYLAEANLAIARANDIAAAEDAR